MMKVTITVALVAILLFGLAGSALAEEETDGGILLFHHEAEGYGPLEVALYDGGGEQPVGLGSSRSGCSPWDTGRRSTWVFTRRASTS
jgi:hypothetical protein